MLVLFPDDVKYLGVRLAHKQRRVIALRSDCLHDAAACRALSIRNMRWVNFVRVGCDKQSFVDLEVERSDA